MHLRCLFFLLALVAIACSESERDQNGGTSSTGASGGTSSSSGGQGTGAGTGTPAGRGGAGSGASGSGGGLPACVTETLLLAEYGQNYECDFTIPGDDDTGVINLVLEVGGSMELLCRRASSQGCDTAGHGGGWWWNGGRALLCDSTCTTLIETPGAKLHVWYGCPSDNCL